ncbi:MAG: PAS domain-containing protein [Deltaproteobacteria bacterium]|nr:PAS domain-containing protein [Deltaproteobacteria bacterium]
METNNPLADIVDSLDIAIWELDTNYRILKDNRKTREIYGEGVVRDFCYHAAAGRNDVCPDCPAQVVLNGQKSGRSQHVRETNSGKTITIDHTATPLRNKAGQLTGFVVSIIDITHL